MAMAMAMESEQYSVPIFCTKLVSLQGQIVWTCIVSVASPFISLVSNLFGRAPEAAPPSRGLLWRIATGLMAAAYVCMLLMILAGVAAAAGVVLVRAWAEQPVYVGESLQFDYTHPHPTALFSVPVPVPVGHTLYVSLLLLMPDSDYNREIGIFQLSAEVISVQGNIIAKSSRPSMLQFRSWPIRYMRTLVMGVPLLLGLSSETQRMTFPILKHKEGGYPRTEDVRITLIPRAGTSSLPQLYEAQVVLQSRPPWTKELLYKWRFTFYVWTTMYIFLILVMVVVLFLKPLIFPVMASEPEEEEDEGREERDVSESLKRWQRSRSRRKAALVHGVAASSASASASSILLSREESAESESSVCE